MTATIGFAASLVDATDSAFTSPVTWANVLDITVPDPQVKKHDASHLGMSTRDMLYIPGLVDGGEVEVSQIYDSTEYARVAALRGTSIHYFKVLDPGGTKYCKWGGFVSAGPVMSFDENLVKMKSKIVVSGAVTIG